MRSLLSPCFNFRSLEGDVVASAQTLPLVELSFANANLMKANSEGQSQSKSVPFLVDNVLMQWWVEWRHPHCPKCLTRTLHSLQRAALLGAFNMNAQEQAPKYSKKR